MPRYAGVNGVNRELTELYFGMNGVNRELMEKFVGIEGVNRKYFEKALPPGVNWTLRQAAVNNNWRRITYGDNLFVAVSSNGTNRIMTSPYNLDWTLRPSGADNITLYSVTYGKPNGIGTYIAVGGASAAGYRGARSNDGINWTLILYSNSAAYIDVAYGEPNGKGLFVTLSFSVGNSYKSSDGITWEHISPPAHQYLGIVYGEPNGKSMFVAFSNSGIITTSPDGNAWSDLPYTPTGSVSMRDITYGEPNGNGLFVIVASSGTHRVRISPDGINWTDIIVPLRTWYAVKYGFGLFVATSDDGYIMTSPDGINWTEIPAPEMNQWLALTYGKNPNGNNGKFVAVAYSGTNRVMTSP